MNLITLILTLLLILVLFFVGDITMMLKRLIGLITEGFFRLLSLFGIQLNRERTVKLSAKFKETYKEIKVVKLSNKNLKEIPSIDWIYLTTFIISLLLIVFNLSVITGNAISDWLYRIFPLGIIPTEADANTFFTAAMFSALSFSLTKVLQRWKDTKQQRLEKREQRLKKKALALLTTKELLDEARIKDKKKKKELQ